MSTIYLGKFKFKSRIYIKIDSPNPSPYVTNVDFQFYGGDLPGGISLDSVTGYIYGTIQSYTMPEYTFAITVQKEDFANIVTSYERIFYRLEIDESSNSYLDWVTTSSLETITIGNISDLYIKAIYVNGNSNINYMQTYGDLPNGITLGMDGSLIGRPLTTGTYSFTAQATTLNERPITRNFSLDVQSTSTQYNQVYARPFLNLETRNYYTNFINDDSIFDSKLIYRFFDPNFGIQTEIKLYLEFALQNTNLDKYTNALKKNFYRKKLYFGEVKFVTANSNTGDPIYDLVYVDIIDPMINKEGVSVSQEISTKVITGYTSTLSNTTTQAGYISVNIPVVESIKHYPSSIDNIRSNLETIRLDNGQNINVDNTQFPRFMKKTYLNGVEEINYIRYVPLCYALPGKGSSIVNKIKFSNFDFSSINFEIDRLIIQSNLVSTSTKYMLISSQTISDNS
jgi:hypothetical protein